MTSNWKTMRNTLVWLLVAVITMAIVVSSPYVIKSNAASLPAVKSCKGLTVKQSGKDWVTVNAKGSQVNYTGVAQNNLGWWRVENGKVNFEATGVYQNDYGWWRVETGKVNFKANKIYQNAYGWWKTTDGKVTFKENGVFQNDFGWWKVKDSRVDFSFTGIASNSNGTWYLEEGKVRFDANFDSEALPVNPYRYKGDWYDVKSGAAKKVDWKTIVIQDAKEIDEEFPSSRKMMVTLLHDNEIGFTKEEAEYGADNAGIDYQDAALRAANLYLENNEISRAMLIKCMDENELFTKAEIDYAMKVIDAEAAEDGLLWKYEAFDYAVELLFPFESERECGGTSRALVQRTLEEELFTQDEIRYVMDILDDDASRDPDFWNEQALAAAQATIDYLKEEGITISQTVLSEIRKELKDELLFTDSEVAYAMNHIKT